MHCYTDTNPEHSFYFFAVRANLHPFRLYGWVGRWSELFYRKCYTPAKRKLRKAIICHQGRILWCVEGHRPEVGRASAAPEEEDFLRKKETTRIYASKWAASSWEILRRSWLNDVVNENVDDLKFRRFESNIRRSV